MSNPLESSAPSEYASFLSSWLSAHHGLGYPTQTSSTFTTAPTPPTTSTPSSTSTSTNPGFTNIPDGFHDSQGFWDRLADGAKAGIIVTIVLAVLIITFLSIWFCCGCCGLRRRNQRRNEILHPKPDTDTVPLQNRQVTMMNRMASTATRGEAPPPLYAEVTPPQHTTIAGGITHVREEEEGIISDGKMPLSEIPFEDVILDHSPSGSFSRNFGDRHMGLGGDTTGHTNS